MLQGWAAVEWGQVLRCGNLNLWSDIVDMCTDSLSSGALTVLLASKCVCCCGHYGCTDLIPIDLSHWFHPELSKLEPGVREDLWKTPFPNQISGRSWSGQGLLLKSVLVCPILLALAFTSRTHSTWQRNPWWPPYSRWTLGRERTQEADWVTQVRCVHRLKERWNIWD